MWVPNAVPVSVKLPSIFSVLILGTLLEFSQYMGTLSSVLCLGQTFVWKFLLDEEMNADEVSKNVESYILQHLSNGLMEIFLQIYLIQTSGNYRSQPDASLLLLLVNHLISIHGQRKKLADSESTYSGCFSVKFSYNQYLPSNSCIGHGFSVREHTRNGCESGCFKT